MGIVVKVRVAGVRQILSAFRALPKDASNELRDANQRISDDLAGKVRAAAEGANAQSGLVAPTVKAMRDRVPSVQAGGRRRAGSQSRRSKGQRPTNASDLIYGSNFGATMLKQFPRPASPDHWFFKTVDANSAQFEREWLEAADNTLRKWGSGG